MIGYLPQVSQIHRALSVRDHLLMAATIRERWYAEDAYQRLDSLGIRLDVPAKTLSGGMQAQLILAIVAATRSPILILDEPLGPLDPLARRDLLLALRVLVADGRTILLSSHNVDDLAIACDRLIVLARGRAILHDAIESALASHRVDMPGKMQSHSVGCFPDEDGLPRILLRDEGSDHLRRPTLKELVLGYLAHGDAR